MQGSGAGGRVFCRYTPRHTITLYTVPTPSLEEGKYTHTYKGIVVFSIHR